MAAYNPYAPAATPQSNAAMGTALDNVTNGNVGSHFGGQYNANQGYGTNGSGLPAGLMGVPGGATVGTIQPGQLMSDQLNGLLASNSPYMQYATQQGLNTAGARGLLNSSLAAGSAQGAAIAAAAPIAQENATQISGLQTTNLNNLNQLKESQTAAAGSIGAAAQGARGQITAANINSQGALQRQREDLAYSGEQAGLNRSFEQGLTQQQYENNLGLANNQFQNTAGLDFLQNGLLQNTAVLQSGLNLNNALTQDQFQLGANLLQGQQNFYSNAGIQAMNNPAIMGDPQAFGGYMQFLMDPFSSTIDNIFKNIPGFGG